VTTEIPSSSIQLELTPSELAGVIEGLHDGILRRLRWSTIEDERYAKWRTLDIAIVQAVMDAMLAAYTKSVMTFREARGKVSGVATDFEDNFSFKQEVWDLLASITIAESWDDMPTHPIHDYMDKCPVCGSIAGIA
jgi:hypothetical protein